MRFRGNRGALFFSVVLVAFVALLLMWPLFAHPACAAYLPAGLVHPPNLVSESAFEAPGAQHWFGTDGHGRDLLARVVSGARISLFVGVIGAAVSLCIGVLWGATAGYCGGRTDGVMMRIVDILYSMPSILFVIILITMLNAWMEKLQTSSDALSDGAAAFVQFAGLFVGLGAVSWLTMSRIVRSEVMSLRQRAFVDASRVLGASHCRILSRHILPNVYGLIVVYLMLSIPSIVLYESFLSYLGLGVQPPQASLGSLMASGAEQINSIRTYWWLIVVPGGTLAFLLLALNYVGDGLRDAWDPRAKVKRG